MSNKVNGLWAVNSSSVFMFFDSVNTPSVWRFEMKDDVESWRMIPGVKNAQAVRGVAAAYRADGGTWLDPNGSDYAQAVSEIGDVPLIVERGDCMVSSDCGDYDKLYEELSAYSDTLTTEQLMDWFIDLNDPETISGWTERIEAHNAYIDVMEPNNAVLRNPLDVDSTFHIRIYDYFIDFHEDREIVDDLEFTPSDVDADDWTEDIKRCLEENGWRLDSKIGTDSDDSDLLVFDCVKA